jgi:hypothetical protein
MMSAISADKIAPHSSLKNRLHNFRIAPPLCIAPTTAKRFCPNYRTSHEAPGYFPTGTRHPH